MKVCFADACRGELGDIVLFGSEIWRFVGGEDEVHNPTKLASPAPMESNGMEFLLDAVDRTRFPLREETAENRIDTDPPLYLRNVQAHAEVLSLHPSGDGGPKELMLVKVTRFACGLLVVGFGGRVIGNFFVAWCQASRRAAVDPSPHDRRGVEFKPFEKVHDVVCDADGDDDEVLVKTSTDSDPSSRAAHSFIVSVNSFPKGGVRRPHEDACTHASPSSSVNDTPHLLIQPRHSTTLFVPGYHLSYVANQFVPVLSCRNSFESFISKLMQEQDLVADFAASDANSTNGLEEQTAGIFHPISFCLEEEIATATWSTSFSSDIRLGYGGEIPDKEWIPMQMTGVDNRTI